MAAAAAAGMETEEGFAEVELEVAAILCDLKSILRARDRRRRRRKRPEIPSWGARRPRSVPELKPPAGTLGPAADRDGAASPDTPLAYPESGGDDAPADEEEEDAKKAAAQEQWVQEQHGMVASLSQEKAHLLKVRMQQQEQQARGLDLNEPAPARAAEEDERARAQAQAVAAAHAAEWFRQAHLRAALQKAAVTAGARRRRLEILRAKTACPLVSSRPRRAGRG